MRTLSIGLVVTVAFAWSAAAAVENARELAGYCQSLERGAKGAERHIYIPRTREALTSPIIRESMLTPPIITVGRTIRRMPAKRREA